MTPGRYILSRDTFSVGGDYTVVDHAGATVLAFDGKLRFAATFVVLAPDGRELFTGKEHVFSLDRRFEFERDGAPYATLLREMTSDPGQILGSASYRYVATLRTGDRLETAGYVLTRWTIARGEETIARIESDGYVHTVDLVDGADGAFVLAVVMAVARLNPPSGLDSRAD
jgi:uncharacterized protein YxjI